MAFYRASIGGGGGGGGVTSYVEAGRDITSTTSHTISGTIPGKKYLALLFQYSAQGTSLAYNRFDNVITSGISSMTKISNLLTTNSAVTGTFFSLTASSTSITISTTEGNRNSRLILFQANT